MSETLMPFRLTGISPKAYEHPADRAATAALKKIPGFDAAVRKLIELQYERATSEVVDRLAPEEIAGVLGHELGHVLSEHMLYRTCLLILMQVTLPRMPLV